MKLRKILLSLGLLSLSSSLASCGTNGYKIEPVSNQGGSVFYEIFVYSFADSNGDGIGDLKGITNKLDYLADLGVSYLWLTPIHKSPSYHKYDVLDYYSIDPKFGTMDDFEELVSKAKEKNIGIIMDMVFNHCSVQSAWFNNWADNIANKESKYYDNFKWSLTPKDGYNYINSVGVYVESRFSETMPEFNLDNPYVREEQENIQKFWLNKGVAGFRYDAVLYYYYDQTEENVTYMKKLVSDCKKVKEDIYQIGEAWTTKDKILNYAKSGMHVFNFPTSENGTPYTFGYVGYPKGIDALASSIYQTQQSYLEANNLYASIAIITLDDFIETTVL